MVLLEIFSKRKRRERGELPDIYIYDKIPNNLRFQIIHIIKEIYFQGDYLTEQSQLTLREIDQVLCREYGIFNLADQYTKDFESIAKFILQEKDHKKVLDVVELTFRVANNSIRENAYYFNRNINVDDAIPELNSRFKEAGVGYQLESGEIIRIDSNLLHSEAVKPALELLREKVFFNG